MRVVLASRNPGKLLEMQALFAALPLQLESQAEHNIPSPAETGSTFVENALIKARFTASQSGLAAIADDSGLVVPALDGAPGIFSARYAGDQATDADNNARLQQNCRRYKTAQGLPASEQIAAFFYCAMVFLRHAEDPTPLIATAAWHGHIIDEPRGANGFGYDPYFLVQAFGQTSAELPAASKNRHSHRGQASAALVAALSELYTDHAG